MQSASRQCIEICMIKKVYFSCYFSSICPNGTPPLLLWTTFEFSIAVTSVQCFSVVMLTITVLFFFNIFCFIVSNTGFICGMLQVEIISLAWRHYSLLHYICFDGWHKQKSSANVGDSYFKNCFCPLPGCMFFPYLLFKFYLGYVSWCLHPFLQLFVPNSSFIKKY